MASELDFSFAALTGPARRHIRVFQVHQFLDRFAMGLTIAVVALALTDRGMDLFQISLLFGVYSLTTIAMELPFGGLADTIGRKPVFLAAVVASVISLALFLSTSDFYGLALSFAFIGFGRALRSGTLVGSSKPSKPLRRMWMFSPLSQKRTGPMPWAWRWGLFWGAFCPISLAQWQRDWVSVSMMCLTR